MKKYLLSRQSVEARSIGGGGDPAYDAFEADPAPSYQHSAIPTDYLRLPTIASSEEGDSSSSPPRDTIDVDGGGVSPWRGGLSSTIDAHRHYLCADDRSDNTRHRRRPSPAMRSADATMAPRLVAPPSTLYPLVGGQIIGATPHHILRSHGPSAQFKSIPNNDRVDLDQYKEKAAHEWGMEDVIAWMIRLAQRHQIPMEGMNIHRFADCNGPKLMLMTRHHFQERDPLYGGLLHVEFCKLVGGENSFIDEWMRRSGDMALPPPSAEPSSSSLGVVVQPTFPPPLVAANNYRLFPNGGEGSLHNGPADLTELTGRRQPINIISNNRPSPLESTPLAVDDSRSHSDYPRLFDDEQRLRNLMFLQQSSSLHGAFPTEAGARGHSLEYHQLKSEPPCSTASSDEWLELKREPPSPTPVLHQTPNGGTKVEKLGKNGRPKANTAHDKNLIKVNKDGKPRKRSQHNRGNKLWEFIRDALDSAATCPAVVRWEDRTEGVFRIVESETLARMWGDKKKNQKMTYEKLSRAMRTYYEKLILVPVPKTGLYPKKLVYKFGPKAGGWSKAAPTTVDPPLTPPSPLVDQRDYDVDGDKTTAATPSGNCT